MGIEYLFYPYYTKIKKVECYFYPFLFYLIFFNTFSVEKAGPLSLKFNTNKALLLGRRIEICRFFRVVLFVIILLDHLRKKAMPIYTNIS